MRFFYALAAYFAAFAAFHLLFTVVFLGIALVKPDEMASAAYELPLLGVVMINEGLTVLIPFAAFLVLLVIALIRWRRPFGWAFAAAALFVLQIGGVAGLFIMGSV